MQAEQATKQVIQALKKTPKARGGNNDIIRFARAFLDHAPDDDLAAFSTDDLTAIVTQAYKFATKRRPGTQKITVINPTRSRDGWGAGYSVIAVINDDMPFLFDSVLGEITARNLETRLVLHPILTVRRDAKGKLAELAPKRGSAGKILRESFMFLVIDRIEDAGVRADIENSLADILNDVRIVVLDWPFMRERATEAIARFQNTPPPVPVDELGEAIQFLDWLRDHNFIFLGMREYRFAGDGAGSKFTAVKGSGLGILRKPTVQVLRRGRELVSITPEVREFLMQPAPLIITKANVQARVHRRVHMDYIGIKQFDAAGALTGELRVIGLFTSGAYTRNPRNIPLLRRKIAEVVERSGILPESHSGKALLNVLESYPRDELFQIDVPTLTEIALGIHQLTERPRTKLFVRKDKFDRFVSVLVYVARDRFNTLVRRNIGATLAEEFDGRVSAYYPSFPEGTLVRVHFIIGRYGGATPSPDLDVLEARIDALTKTWDDKLNAALGSTYEPRQHARLWARYGRAFSAAFQEAYAPGVALTDIVHFEALADGASGPRVSFYKHQQDRGVALRVKLYNRQDPIALSNRLPILENFGLKAISERSYNIIGRDDAGITFWLHDIILESAGKEPIAFEAVKPLLEDGFRAVWQGACENDRYNSLIASREMPWRDVSVLRAASLYLRQTGIAFSTEYMAATLVKHARFADLLVQLFYARFEPGTGSTKERDGKARRLIKKIDQGLNDVSSLDEDRIIRRFVNLFTSIWRTNYFQRGRDHDPRPALAFKINSQQVDGLPEPRPFAEIFVYAPDVEGVHLRGGAIARGGLRWSDRPEDFRTEVLGLAKAQQVKNAVIVPVGAKGGFVPKALPAGGSRDDIVAEAIRCYQIFIQSLLDVSDNIIKDALVPPENVVRHDGDDPYLVVAADKGTATFSDIANGISQANDFWLDDAFASGGSAGYDHKKMGITARGAWEAVKRHFREMDIDIQTTPFTVIGVGDMSGDVFGNGMLLSKQIKLVAAFDHRDVFIDPDPDPAASYKERARMFKLARSTWRDYSEKLISKGGGIFSRAAKSINLSPEMKKLTGLRADHATPDELIHALLKAKADLMWFGGIGTYIKASDETDAEAGDRANDPIRIDAKELNIKVIGEGANLGITQLGRIEFAQKGGRVNTDAVDNSAGVNSSDMEVNIKIALGAVEAAGKLTRKDRNKLLAAMTDEVAALVLRNNYQQSLSLTLSAAQGLREMDFQSRFMRALEHDGKLDRAIEFLPDDMAMSEREAAAKPLTRPELSVLMAYAKITLFDQLLAGDVPDDPYLGKELMRYFPKRMQDKYAAVLKTHRLRREIISTMLANSMINRGGATFISRLRDETGADVAAIAAAFALARDCFGLSTLNSAVDALDNKIPSKLQIELYQSLGALLHEQTIWFLRHVPLDTGLERQVKRFAAGITEISKTFNKTLPGALAETAARERARLCDAGVPEGLAGVFARLPYLRRAPEIVTVAEQTKPSLQDCAKVFFALGQELHITRLVAEAGKIETDDYFSRLAVAREVESLYSAQRGLAVAALKLGERNGMAQWRKRNQERLHRTETALNEVLAGGEVTLARLSVAGGYVRDLLPS